SLGSAGLQRAGSRSGAESQGRPVLECRRVEARADRSAGRVSRAQARRGRAPGDRAQGEDEGAPGLRGEGFLAPGLKRGFGVATAATRKRCTKEAGLRARLFSCRIRFKLAP